MGGGVRQAGFTGGDGVTDLEKWDRRFLRRAALVAESSKDPSTRVGAVIVDGMRRPVSDGYNGFPMGVADTPGRLNDRETKLKLILHAELNAVLFANRDLDGCAVYTWPFMPCSRCAAALIQKRVNRVVSFAGAPRRWAGDFALAAEMFAEVGVTLTLYPKEDEQG